MAKVELVIDADSLVLVLLVHAMVIVKAFCGIPRSLSIISRAARGEAVAVRAKLEMSDQPNDFILGSGLGTEGGRRNQGAGPRQGILPHPKQWDCEV